MIPFLFFIINFIFYLNVDSTYFIQYHKTMLDHFHIKTETQMFTLRSFQYDSGSNKFFAYCTNDKLKKICLSQSRFFVTDKNFQKFLIGK